MTCKKPASRRGRTHRARCRRRQNDSSLRPVQDRSPEILAFLRWLKRHGFKNEHHLQVYQFPNAGRGIYVVKHALVKDQTLSIPLSCLVLPSEICKLHPELYSHFADGGHCLMAWLMCERAKMDRSEHSGQGRYDPYLAVLPLQYDLMFMNCKYQNEVAQSLPNQFYQMILEARDIYHQTKCAIKKIIDEHNLHHSIQFNEELFGWAYGVVNTRSLDPNPDKSAEGIQDDVALVPFFDLANHSSYARHYVKTNRNEGLFYLKFQETVSKFSPLFVDYFHNGISNRELLINYNFAVVYPSIPAMVANQLRPLCVLPTTHDQFVISFQRMKKILKSANNPWYFRVNKQMDKLKDLLDKQGKESSFVIHWPSLLTFQSRYLASLDPDLNPIILNRSGEKEIKNSLSLLVPFSVLSSNLEWLVTLLARSSLCKKDNLQEAIAKANVEYRAGPVVSLTTAEQKQYFWAQLFIIDYLLQYEFALSLAPSVSNSDTWYEKVVATIERYAWFGEPLAGLFRNEIIMLVFVRQLLQYRLNQVGTKWSIDVEDPEVF